MSDEEKIVTQEEIDRFEFPDNPDIRGDIKNLCVLINNELNTLDKQLNKIPEKSLKKTRKKLNKILFDIIDIRKV